MTQPRQEKKLNHGPKDHTNFGQLAYMNRVRKEIILADEVPPGYVLTTLPNGDVDWLPTGAAAGTVSVFVFRPGGTTSGNVYADWSDLYADLSVVEGLRLVRIDTSLAAATIPSGTYDLEDVTLVGDPDDQRTLVSVADGVTLTNFPRLQDIHFRYLGTSDPLYTVSGSKTLQFINSCLEASGTEPIIDQTGAGAVLEVLMQDRSEYLTGSTTVHSMGTTQSATYLLDEQSGPRANTIDGGVGSSLEFCVRDASATYGYQTSPTYDGTFTVTRKGKSANLETLEVVLEFPDSVAPGTAIDIQAGTYIGGGPATVVGDTITLPRTGAEFAADGAIQVLLNGQNLERGASIGSEEAQWVSTTQLAFSMRIKKGSSIKVVF